MNRKQEARSGEDKSQKPSLGWGLKFYVFLLASAAGALLGYVFSARPLSREPAILLAVAFTALVCLAGLYPIHFSPKTKVSIGTAAVFAAVFCLDPLVAVLAVALAVAVSQTLTKKGLVNTIFSASQAVLYTGAASLVFWTVNGDNPSALFSSGQNTFALILAALTLYSVNSVAVALAVAMQLGRNPLQIWLTGTRQSVAPELALLALGSVSAICIKQAPWSLAVLLIPVLVIYQSIKRMAQLNQQVARQMEELKMTQAQLVESARLASVGTMMAGIAHQINNPMFVVKGRAEMLLEDAALHLKSDAARQYVQVIYNMADRVSRIVNSLLPSRRVADDGSACASINEVLDNVTALLEPKIMRGGVELVPQLAADLPLARGEASEMQELFINLVDNACNASYAGDGTVVTQIEDSGTGIAQENLGRIFSPFFTTRKAGGGIGLGLYVARHIAEKNGGRITVKSEIGKGTIFTVILPESQKTGEKSAREAMLAASGSGSPRP
jgi:signal transduction histidine kinase